LGLKRDLKMVKRVVKVYLSKEQVEMLQEVCRKLGRDYSGFFQDLLMRYLEDVGVVRERLRNGEKIHHRPRTYAN